jgi:hypothetical protein
MNSEPDGEVRQLRAPSPAVSKRTAEARELVQVFGEAKPSTSRLVWAEESGDFGCGSVGFIE